MTTRTRFKPLERARDERGAALVIALLVMVICALLGAASILTSQTEIQIALNDRIYRDSLMNADAGVQFLRNEDLVAMSGWSAGQLTSFNNNIAGTNSNIFFEVPNLPFLAWNDPSAGGAGVYRVQVRGIDRTGKGSVTLEVDIRPAPQAGEVDQGGGTTTY